MTQPGPDERLARWSGTLLRVGVGLAALLVSAGAVAFLVRHGHEPAAYGAFRGEPSELTSLPAMVRAAARGSARAIIQLGLVVLMATPAARVALSVAIFAYQRDRTYTLLSLLVLATLCYSLVTGGR